MQQNKKLTLLTSNTCGPCFALKSTLKKKNLSVDEMVFPDNIEFFQKHNIKTVPRLVIEEGDDVRIIQGMDDIVSEIEQHKNSL
jgi:glutaredoxin